MKLFFILAVLCFLFSISAGETTEETPTIAEVTEVKPNGPKIVFPRRKYIRRRFGAHGRTTPSPSGPEENSDGNVTYSVSMSSSVSEVHDDHEEEEELPEEPYSYKPMRKPWRPKKFLPRSKPFRITITTTTTTTTTTPTPRTRFTLRPSYPRTKKFTPFEFKKLTTTTPIPEASNEDLIKITTHRWYKRPVHPKLIFNKNRFAIPSTTLPTTTTDQPPELPQTETPNASFKPKARHHFFKPSNRPLIKSSLKKLYKPTTEGSTTIAGREDSVEEAVPELSSTTSTTPTPPAETTTTETSTTTTTSTSTTTTTSTTPATIASNEYISSASSSREEILAKSKEKDMIIIPVPPSQRKPYHPVIMQVTKSPGVSSTERPQTKVVTYKLNKMFVPLGIYGKVLQKSDMPYNGSAGTDLGLSTPAPKPYKGTRTPQIRHKGTSSEELMASSDESSDFATAIRPFDTTMTEADEIFSAQEWAPHFQKAKKESSQQRPSKQFMHASEVDLTTNYKPDINTISLTTQRPNINAISLTTTEMSGYRPLGNEYKNHNSMTHMGPPRPFDKPSRPSSLVESIKSAAVSAASSIPGLIHGGLTTLSHYAPFEESPYDSSSTASPTKSSVTLGAPDEETLEYFRKRPHLIKPTTNYASQQGNHFQPSYSSGGFKPVTAPPHFAKSYYASTPTTSRPSSTTARPSYDEPKYESHRPSVGRSPKNVQQGKKENSKEYLDQLVETSNKYKFSATASPFESDLIRNQWKELNEKYTQEDLQEATSNIYSLFSGPSPPSVDQMMYMKPPGHWSRKSTSAFHDLLKMFRLGFSYGQSTTPVRMHVTTHDKPAHSYDSGDSYKSHGGARDFALGTNLRSSTVSETQDRPPTDGWRPLKSTSSFLKEPFLSFNAAISFRSTPKPTGSHLGHGGSHYSSSSKPFVPGKFTGLKSLHGSSYAPSSSYVEASLGDYTPSKGSGFLSSSYSGSSYTGSTPSPYHSSSSLSGSSHGSLYSDGDSYGSPKGGSSLLTAYKPSSTYSSQASGPAKYIQKPSTPDYADAYYRNHQNKEANGKYEAATVEEYRPPANFANLYENDPGIELIPSSSYYKAKEAGIISSGEIAAVLKPENMSDDDIKSQLPQEVSNIPQITYPNGKVPQQLQTLSQLNEYFQNSEPTAQNQVHFQPPLYRIIQQSMQSQAEQLSGLHKQAGLLLNKPVDTQLEDLFKAQEQPSSQSQQYSESGLASFLESSNPQVQHHHHQMPTQVQHHHSHQVVPANNREQTYEHLAFQPTEDYRPEPAQQPPAHHSVSSQFIQHHVHQQPPQFQQQPLQQQHHHHHHHLQQQQHHHQQLPQQQYHHHEQQPQHHHHQQQPQQQQYSLPEHLQPQPLFQQPPQQVVQKEAHAAKPQGGLSFTDFELPPGVDPDIASLLKAELDKDDIPDEFRKEFENQEKAKQQKEQSVGASNIKPTIVKPPAQRRDGQDQSAKTVFHKPIPISPTLLTPSKRGGRPIKPPAQIPKYVLDLARKLRTDKDLQGIVRVTSKKDGGPPIEYLYPVRG